MKFYFDIRLRDAIAADHDGVDFQTLAEAISAAHAEAAGLVADAKRQSEALGATAVVVRDATGQIIAEVPINRDTPPANNPNSGCKTAGDHQIRFTLRETEGLLP